MSYAKLRKCQRGRGALKRKVGWCCFAVPKSHFGKKEERGREEQFINSPPKKKEKKAFLGVRILVQKNSLFQKEKKKKRNDLRIRKLLVHLSCGFFVCLFVQLR